MKANFNITIFRAINEKSRVSIAFNLILSKLHTKIYCYIENYRKNKIKKDKNKQIEMNMELTQKRMKRKIK